MSLASGQLDDSFPVKRGSLQELPPLSQFSPPSDHTEVMKKGQKEITVVKSMSLSVVVPIVVTH